MSILQLNVMQEELVYMEAYDVLYLAFLAG